jgi:hypothetical protein
MPSVPKLARGRRASPPRCSRGSLAWGRPHRAPVRRHRAGSAFSTALTPRGRDGDVVIRCRWLVEAQRQRFRFNSARPRPTRPLRAEFFLQPGEPLVELEVARADAERDAWRLAKLDLQRGVREGRFSQEPCKAVTRTRLESARIAPLRC